MDKIDTGGCAYPEITSDIVGYGNEAVVDTYSYGGMTLMDYFAGLVTVSKEEIEEMDDTLGDVRSSGKILEGVELSAFLEAQIRYIKASAMVAEKRSLETPCE